LEQNAERYSWLVEKHSVERWRDRRGSLCIQDVCPRGTTGYVLAPVGFSAEPSHDRYCRWVWNVSCLTNGHAPGRVTSFDLCYLDFCDRIGVAFDNCQEASSNKHCTDRSNRNIYISTKARTDVDPRT